MPFRKVSRSLAFRLFFLIASVQTVILLGLTYAVVHLQERDLMERVLESAETVSDLIARSTRYSMLLNQKEDVHNIVASVGGQAGINGIRIYNKAGEVIFGTGPLDLHTKVDMNAEACVSCHTGSGLEGLTAHGKEMSRIFTTASGERVVGLITPIRNEAACSGGPCHAHPASKTILGVLDVKMSLANVDVQLARSQSTLLGISLAAVILVGLVAGAFLWVFVRRPVRALREGMSVVASGRLDQRLEIRGKSELAVLARTFNEMTEDLQRARREITAWSETLEQKVREKTADLERAHRQMVHVEKMASLGNLSSSVAHELNNPLEGILTFAKLLHKRIGKISLPKEVIAGYQEELKLIADEAQRCGTIVKNLLVFSRQWGAEFRKARFREILGRCVLLVNHHAEINGVVIRTTCTDDDELECDPGQLQQVLVALMVNAIEAMCPTPERAAGGTLTVDVTWAAVKDALVIRIADSGIGMSDEVKAHIFEPFFTTKSEGKGNGLGLAIAYGIIQRHHGTIELESTPGVGTVFTITMPVRPPQDAAVHATSAPVEGAHS